MKSLCCVAKDTHFSALRFHGGNAYFQQLLILRRLTGYYFRVINSYSIQYGCFLVRFVLEPCVRYGYNSRMAKTSERLNAIHNYMKKVKSNISMVFGLVS